MSWPEPIVRVQSLAESGITAIPDVYVKPPSKRPSPPETGHADADVNIPVIDLQALLSDDKIVRDTALGLMSSACMEWGFFHVVNHGVSHELMRGVRDTWREFFEQPLEVKQEYSNEPSTYEGYGSRLGVEKGAILDWSDYFYLNYMPPQLRNPTKWPALPSSCRKLIEEFCEASIRLCGILMKVLSVNLGLGEDQLLTAFGGEENVGASLRVNFYPKCPQPDLTLGLSEHSDPSGITLILADEDVSGLQVRRGDSWVTVRPIANAFVVNIGDQMEVLSNEIYKSVEHRVTVNSVKDRLSLALFYNPQSDLMIEPAKALVTEDRPAMYSPMTLDEYRLFIRTKGPSGKDGLKDFKRDPRPNI